MHARAVAAASRHGEELPRTGYASELALAPIGLLVTYPAAGRPLSLSLRPNSSNNTSMSSRIRREHFIDPFQPAQIRRLVREFGSPLLILDTERVRVQFRKLRKALPGANKR